MTRKTLSLFAAAGVVPGLVFLREVVAARGCLAGGGAYDFLHALCYMHGSREAVSMTHNPLVWVGVFLVAKGTAVLVFTFRNPLLAACGALLVASRRFFGRGLSQAPR